MPSFPPSRGASASETAERCIIQAEASGPRTHERHRKFETLLRREVKKTAQYYVHKVEALLEAVQKVLKAGDPVRHICLTV